MDKGALDPHAEVWEKLWDGKLHQRFLDSRKTKDVVEKAWRLEKMVGTMAEEIGEELYLDNRESVINSNGLGRSAKQIGRQRT